MHTRLSTLALAALFLASAAFGGTGAVPLLDSRDAIHEHVTLQPAEGPGTNGEYARLDGDGELLVDLTGANPDVEGSGIAPDSVTNVSGVFEITYDGDRNAAVWLTHDAGAVTFLVDGRPVESSDAAVVLGSGEAASVGLRVDSTDADPRAVTSVTVHARLPDGSAADGEDVDDGDLVDVPGREENDESEDPPATATPDPTERPRTRVVVTVTADGYRLDVTNARAGEPIEDVAFGAGDGNVRLESLTFVPPRDGDYTVTIQESDHGDFGTGGVPGVTRLGLVRIDPERPDPGIDRATVEISVTESWLERREVSPASVALYRHAGGTWTELDTDLIGQRGDRYVFTAPAPGLSVFGVAGEAVTDSPTDARSSSAPPPTEPPTTERPSPDAGPGPVERGDVGILSILLVALLLVVLLTGLELYQRER